MLTLEAAKKLKYGDILIQQVNPVVTKRWKVNGEVKLWKKPENSHRIRVPLKHGLYSYGALTELDFDNFDNCESMTKEPGYGE